MIGWRLKIFTSVSQTNQIETVDWELCVLNNHTHTRIDPNTIKNSCSSMLCSSLVLCYSFGGITPTPILFSFFVWIEFDWKHKKKITLYRTFSPHHPLVIVLRFDGSKTSQRFCPFLSIFSIDTDIFFSLLWWSKNFGNFYSDLFCIVWDIQ